MMASFQVTIGKTLWEARGEDKQWVLYRFKKVKKKDKKEGDDWLVIGFYPTLAGLIHVLFEKKIRGSEAKTLTEIQMEMKKIKDELAGMYDTNIG
jgi:hypothetical protein